MFKDKAKEGKPVVRLAYDPERVEALLGRLRRMVQKRAQPKTRGPRILLLGDGRGEEHYLAQRLADALSSRLLCLPVRRALRMSEADLGKLLGRAARAKAVLLIEQAEELFDKRGRTRPPKARSGANAKRMLETLRRRRGTTLLSSDDTGPRVEAVLAWIDLVVTFGDRCDGAERELDVPVTTRNFSVAIDGRDCSCAEVRGLGSGRTSADEEHPPVVAFSRALGASRNFFEWRAAIERGEDDTRDIIVHLLDEAAGESVAAWRLKDAYPVAWTGPELNAMANEVAMETLEVRFGSLEWITTHDNPRRK